MQLSLENESALAVSRTEDIIIRIVKSLIKLIRWKIDLNFGSSRGSFVHNHQVDLRSSQLINGSFASVVVSVELAVGIVYIFQFFDSFN